MNDLLFHKGKEVTGVKVGADGVVGFITEDHEELHMQLSEFMDGDFNPSLKQKMISSWQGLCDITNEDKLPYDRNGNKR